MRVYDAMPCACLARRHQGEGDQLGGLRGLLDQRRHRRYVGGRVGRPVGPQLLVTGVAEGVVQGLGMGGAQRLQRDVAAGEGDRHRPLPAAPAGHDVTDLLAVVVGRRHALTLGSRYDRARRGRPDRPTQRHRAASSARQPAAGGCTCAAARSAATSAAATRSPAQHATAHFHGTGHPVITSFEPGEDWFWDFSAEAGFNGPEMCPATERPLDQTVPGPADRVPTDWRDHIH